MAGNPVISRPVVTRVMDVREIVERLDPDRHSPMVAYQFSNGRKFVKRQEYRDVAPTYDDYGDGVGNQYVDDIGDTYVG